jgi:ribosomal protein S18 acetylase RimI-like enzyme
MIFVRPFRLADYAAVIQIWKEASMSLEKSDTLEAVAKQLAWNSDLILVAEVEEQVVGVVVGSMDGYRAYFYRMAVLPAFQKQGIGKKLMQSLEKRFSEKGAKQIFIHVDQVNDRSLGFYQGLGYHVEHYITLSKDL